jgi:hypothetical protein
MAHVTASLNRLFEPQLATLASVRNRPTAPPNVATDGGTSTSGTSASGTSTSGTSASGTSASGSSGSSASSDSGESDFQNLFNSQTSSQTSTTQAAAAPAASSTSAATPTVQSVFGASPWETDPTGTTPEGTTFNYNPWYFATPAAATQVAQMLGGTVVSSNEFTAPGSPFIQQQPNLMVQMPNGNQINAGLVASLYTHGYSQSYINTLIQDDINGAAY